MWVLGAINTSLKKLRLEITFDRGMETIKRFLYTRIKYGIRIVHDILAGYNWLENDINYENSPHCHDHGNFGYGLDSTSHIESFWSNFQLKIKQLYYQIPN